MGMLQKLIEMSDIMVEGGELSCNSLIFPSEVKYTNPCKYCNAACCRYGDVCEALSGNRCTIYDARPTACKAFSCREMFEVLGEDEGFFHENPHVLDLLKKNINK